MESEDPICSNTPGDSDSQLGTLFCKRTLSFAQKKLHESWRSFHDTLPNLRIAHDPWPHDLGDGTLNCHVGSRFEEGRFSISSWQRKQTAITAGIEAFPRLHHPDSASNNSSLLVSSLAPLCRSRGPTKHFRLPLFIASRRQEQVLCKIIFPLFH